MLLSLEIPSLSPTNMVVENDEISWYCWRGGQSVYIFLVFCVHALSIFLATGTNVENILTIYHGNIYLPVQDK